MSGQRDGKVRLWNLATGECLAALTGHSDIVRSVQISPDGSHAISGSDDGTVKVWDLETRTCVGTLEGHQKEVFSIAVSTDGTLVASTGYHDHTVRLWDWKSGVCLQVITTAVPLPVSVAFTPDGLRLVVGTADGTILVYRLTDAKIAAPAEPTRRYVNAKVVLIGESTVGKTTLAHRLISDRYVKTDSTHGMNVWPLDLPLAPDETMEREVLLWDLAGQEDYRLIHRLYLSRKPAKARSVLAGASVSLAWQKIHPRVVANGSRFPAARDVPGRDRPPLAKTQPTATMQGLPGRFQP